MEPLHIGIIGYGGFGRFLHAAWSKMDDARVVCVSDSDPSRLPPAEVHVHTDWRRLVSDPDVDVVSVATPPHLHEPMTLAALEAGKHVVVEKPVALDRDAAMRMRDAARRSGRVATVDFMMRFNPVVEALQELARRNVFGRPRRVNLENYAQDESLDREHWFWDRDRSGGILVEHAVHFIDITNALAGGVPAEVVGFAVERAAGWVDRMALSSTYPCGLVAGQYHAFSRPGFFERTRLQVVFDLAEIEVEGWIPRTGRIRALTGPHDGEWSAFLPNLRIDSDTPIAELPDESRPKGWGGQGSGTRRLVRSSGVAYDVGRLVEGTFGLEVDKATAYADALRALMGDVARAIRDPEHRLRVTMEDGVASLEVALEATRFAMSRANR